MYYKFHPEYIGFSYSLDFTTITLTWFFALLTSGFQLQCLLISYHNFFTDMSCTGWRGAKKLTKTNHSTSLTLIWVLKETITCFGSISKLVSCNIFVIQWQVHIRSFIRRSTRDRSLDCFLQTLRNSTFLGNLWQTKIKRCI